MPRQTPISRKLRAFLKGKAVTVSLHRNGLSLEMAEVPAELMTAVSSELLNTARVLVNAGFDELVPDAGGVHGGPLGEYRDDDHAEEAVKPRARIGFVG